MPALAGARYLAGSADIARCRAAAARPRQVTASRALALLAPSLAAVKRNEFGPGWSFAGTTNDPSALGLTAVRVPSGPCMYTVAAAGLTTPRSLGLVALVV
jgi:hypothetical protein